MWSALPGWIRGTAIIAVLHGVVIGTALTIMGVPLVAPLGVLVFIGSFILIIGSFLFGGFAVLVTFASQGWVDALIVIKILILVNQAESHLLQPILIGRYVQLNALAVVLALTAGALLWGIADPRRAAHRSHPCRTQGASRVVSHRCRPSRPH